jgi:hypothetical protein
MQRFKNITSQRIELPNGLCFEAGEERTTHNHDLEFVAGNSSFRELPPLPGADAPAEAPAEAPAKVGRASKAAKAEEAPAEPDPSAEPEPATEASDSGDMSTSDLSGHGRQSRSPRGR